MSYRWRHTTVSMVLDPQETAPKHHIVPLCGYLLIGIAIIIINTIVLLYQANGYRVDNVLV